MPIGSVRAEQVSEQGDYTVQPEDGTFTSSYNTEGEVASVPLPCREHCHEDPSASHVHGGANATDTREEAGNSGGTDNLPLQGNVRQVHPAAKWDIMLHYKWDLGIFTPSFNREGEVANTPPLCTPLKHRSKHRQALSKGGAQQQDWGEDGAKKAT